MALTVNAKTYNADSFQKDSVAYIGTLKTVSVKDDIKLSRVAPKPTDTFSGVGRNQAKITRTLALTGAKTLLGDAIITVDVSVPVGYLAADVDSLVTDFSAWLGTAAFKTAVKSQQVSF